MRELRKVTKAVKDYEKLLTEDPQNAKTYQKEYRNDVEILVAVIQTYLNTTAEILQTWCEISVEVFDMPTNNLFQRIKRTIHMTIVNHYLNRLSLEMSKAGKLQTALTKIQTRFMQYQYFCPN